MAAAEPAEREPTAIGAIAAALLGTAPAPPRGTPGRRHHWPGEPVQRRRGAVRLCEKCCRLTLRTLCSRCSPV